MDINEVTDKRINRHPWELSRTESVLSEIFPYIKKCNQESDFINIGAGDMFFDKHILKLFKGHKLHAVDIGYGSEKVKLIRRKSSRINIYETLEDVTTSDMDYALMMDSLEYMQDDVAFVKSLLKKVKKGGYLFFTLPAFNYLNSEHDIIVGNLRRYDKKSFIKIIDQIDGLKMIKMHYFYTSLWLVRVIQKVFHMEIDPQHKVTTGWKHRNNSFITIVVKTILNIDYNINMKLANIGLDFPGLSLLVICKYD